MATRRCVAMFPAWVTACPANDAGGHASRRGDLATKSRHTLERSHCPKCGSARRGGRGQAKRRRLCRKCRLPHSLSLPWTRPDRRRISPPAAPGIYSTACPNLYDPCGGRQLWTGISLACRRFWWHNTAHRSKRGWFGWRARWSFGYGSRRTPVSTRFRDATPVRGGYHGKGQVFYLRQGD